MQILSALLLPLGIASTALAVALPEPVPGVAEIVAYIDHLPGGKVPEEYQNTEKRAAEVVLIVCKDSDFRNCVVLKPGSGICSIIPPNYDNTISSIVINDESFCYLFRQNTCTNGPNGGNVLGIGAGAPHSYSNLLAQNYNDDISSVYCS